MGPFHPVWSSPWFFPGVEIPMRIRLLLVALLAAAVCQLGALTCQPGTTIKITSPTGDVTTTSFTRLRIPM